MTVLTRREEAAEPAVRWKRDAAERATEWVRDGMVVGLGAGTTALFAVTRLATLLASGKLSRIVCVPCSRSVGIAAARLGIELTTLEAHPHVDLTIDGADEVDPQLAVIKGAGGALLHEKIVAQASRREIIVVDDSKLSAVLGTRQPVPVEVLRFGWRTQAQYLESLGARVELRTGPMGAPFRTDQNNLILDGWFGQITDPRALARALADRAGIVAHGLFLDEATDLVVAGDTGIRHVSRKEGARA